MQVTYYSGCEIFMLDNMENLKIISSLRQPSKPHALIKSRTCHGFVARIHGEVRYDFEDRSVTVKEGEMIFIPQGVKYEYTTLSEEKSLDTSINFTADFDPSEIKVYPIDGFYEAEFVKDKFSESWKFGTQADKYKCLSVFYALLSHISAIEQADYADKRKYHIIDPAVKYLREHIYDCTLKINELHKICGVSDTYFRKIFILRFGTNPGDYITSKRISHAKVIIDSGDYDSIKEVAFSVGYNDPLYFGKVYRKIYGISPSKDK